MLNHAYQLANTINMNFRSVWGWCHGCSAITRPFRAILFSPNTTFGKQTGSLLLKRWQWDFELKFATCLFLNPCTITAIWHQLTELSLGSWSQQTHKTVQINIQLLTRIEIQQFSGSNTSSLKQLFIIPKNEMVYAKKVWWWLQIRNTSRHETEVEIVFCSLL